MSFYNRLRGLLIGRPIASKYAHDERLPKLLALPIFASDAVSSVAYASEEIMHAFKNSAEKGLFGLKAGDGSAFYHYTFAISIAICVLIAIVTTSYLQTIKAYPDGGGAYTVSKENLGKRASMMAGASLLIDYVLTVAVSISACLAALISLNPAVDDVKVPLALTFILIITIVNLRGAKENGKVFAVPAYGFILLLVGVAVVGFFKQPLAGGPSIHHAAPPPLDTMTFAFLMMKCFSSGCTALTGIEAVANGTTAFKEPTSRNANITLIWLVCILSGLFLSLSYLANKFGAVPVDTIIGFDSVKNVPIAETRTVVAQICAGVFGQGLYYGALQIFTAAILFLAANTAYAAFPRLASLVAQDNFLPRQLGTVGDRLVYKNGIIALSVVAGALVIGFDANTHKLLPLYAVGVFIGFTLSQFGMFNRTRRLKGPAPSWMLSFVGGCITTFVAIILMVFKWSDGAWLVPFAMAAMFFLFTGVERHYRYLAKELMVEQTEQVPDIHGITLLLVPRVHRGVLQAIGYAKSTAKDCRALHVTLDPKNTGQIKHDWDKHGGDIPLVILESPYRSLVEPIIEYVDQTLEEDPNLMVTVIVPQAVPKKWWHSALHSNIAVPLKIALGGKKNVVITNVRYFLK